MKRKPKPADAVAEVTKDARNGPQPPSESGPSGPWLPVTDGCEFIPSPGYLRLLEANRDGAKKTPQVS